MFFNVFLRRDTNDRGAFGRQAHIENFQEACQWTARKRFDFATESNILGREYKIRQSMASQAGFWGGLQYP